MTMTTDDKATAVASMHAMGSGALADLAAVYADDCINREAEDEPPNTRGVGPAAMYATARWLRSAFSDLAWEVHDVVHEGDLVVVHATMSGRRTGPSSRTGPTPGSNRRSRHRIDGSPSPNLTGSVCATAKSPSTGPTATTSAWANNSAGHRRPRFTLPACGWLRGALDAHSNPARAVDGSAVD